MITLSSKGQIVIPERIRSQLGLKAGQKLGIFIWDGVMHLVPVPPPGSLFGSVPGLEPFVRDDEDRFKD